MLQQILRDMTIDSELLAELSDDQKQILFCKMREEQIRRWKAREEKLEEEEEKKKINKPKPPPKPGTLQSGKTGGNKKTRKTVDFRLASDGNPWVWVMGEHENDNTIEEILELEQHERAQKLAEEEAEALRKKVEEEEAKHLQEEEERIARKKAEEEERLRKEAEQAAHLESLKEARLAAQKIEEEKRKSDSEANRRLQELKEKQQHELEEQEEKLRQRTLNRATQIYLNFKKTREKIKKMAEESGSENEAAWKEQEKRAKEAEHKIREIARKAREEHRRSSVKSNDGDVAVTNNNNIIRSETLPNHTPAPNHLKAQRKSKPAKPANRQAIIDWFKTEEILRHAGIDHSGKMAPWFHGIIPRQEAESLLEEREVGSFLVRVSERIWGYAISYKSPERCKHFLIDCSDGTYQFFGTNQLAHKSLASIIAFHRKIPITQLGKEYLLTPVGQTGDAPDYEELFTAEDDKEKTKI